MKAKINQIRNTILKNSPGYEPHIEKDLSYTSKIMYARTKVGFSRLFAPGIHIEAEDYIFDKRLKGTFFKHWRYFGPRGELLFYFFFVLGMTTLFRNNLSRDENIENILNDREVYTKVDLPLNDRIIK